MNLIDVAEKFGAPVYVYDAQVIRDQIETLKTTIGKNPNAKFLYAIKANFNPKVVRLILSKDIGIDAVSLEEVKLGLHCGCPSENIMFTENNMSDDDMHEASKLGVLINFGSMRRLEAYGQAYPGSKISIRFNPNVGAASHATNITGGPDSKFGISYEYVDDAIEIAKKYDLQIVGIHEHIGSGWLGLEEPLLAMDALLEIAKKIPNLQFVDFGGGFGVPYKPDQTPLDLEALGQEFDRKFQEFCKVYGSEIEMRFEPGRYLVAQAGHLVAQVTDVKKTPEGKRFVGLNTGMNHLARPAMYGSYHPIRNLSNPRGELLKYDVVGNICESADFFAKNRQLPEMRPGDYVSLDIAGAYGMSMASHYQFRPLPAEVLLDNGEATLIRERRNFDQMLKCQFKEV